MVLLGSSVLAVISAGLAASSAMKTAVASPCSNVLNVLLIYIYLNVEHFSKLGNLRIDLFIRTIVSSTGKLWVAGKQPVEDRSPVLLISLFKNVLLSTRP